MKIDIRIISEDDYEKASEIVCRNFMEVNIKDYSKEEMEKYCKVFTSDKLKKISKKGHMYVACIDGEIVGCGAIHSFFGKEDESTLRTFFIKPELQGKGIGKELIKVIENDEIFKRAKRIEVAASITSYEFYKKMGYRDLNGIKKLDEEGNYHVEKFRKI